MNIFKTVTLILLSSDRPLYADYFTVDVFQSSGSPFVGISGIIFSCFLFAS